MSTLQILRFLEGLMLLRVEDQIHCWLLVETHSPTFEGVVVCDHLNQVLPGLSFNILEQSKDTHIVLSDSPPEIYAH